MLVDGALVPSEDGTSSALYYIALATVFATDRDGQALAELGTLIAPCVVAFAGT